MIPSAGPLHQGRRHGEHPFQYQLPPQPHSPVHPHPYAQYHHHPQPYGAPLTSPYAQPVPQWYNPYAHPQPHYVMPPRPFHPQPHGSPVVVHSHPHMGPMTPVNRAMGQTPPVAHSRTPPVARLPTPQPAPSTPSAASMTQVNCLTPTTDMTTPTPPPIQPPRSSRPAEQKESFQPPLPWLSVPEEPFPPRASYKRRRRRREPVSGDEKDFSAPAGIRDGEGAEKAPEETTDNVAVKDEKKEDNAEAAVSEEADVASQASTAVAGSEANTPATSHAPSEDGSVHPRTRPAQPTPRTSTASHARNPTIPAVPLLPIKPIRPGSVTSTTQKSAKTAADKLEPSKADAPAAEIPKAEGAAEEAPKPEPPAKPVAKSWADLVRSKAAPAPAPSPATNGIVAAAGPAPSKSNSLSDALASFSVNAEKRVSFLEPRGLVNSGNLCYMNSILQVLLFCAPFYDFLDQVAKRAVHSFKSETPLIDAMIMFMRDFKIIDSAESPEKLRLRLKDTELEQYGDPLAPEYVYDVIRRIPRFENMKRGQQEDAEEFLGFLLDVMHDECAHVIKSGRGASADADTVTSPTSERSASADSGWLEVGPKQKTAVTQRSGTIDVESPVTKIFGGKLRSEYRRPGEKPSVTLEAYQPLQLDIGAPDVHNITDALKGLTHLETLESATRGGRSATKQVFIDTLPPVLILHLKRFHYDANGPHKIWKKIGYPLELQIPKEVFPPHARGALGVRGGPPRYRLIGVVYHHGKNASGGHYTVDLRRQEGREWIRVDDTVIRRIRSEDVAEGGAEEDPKLLAAALEQHKTDAGTGATRNFYELGENEEKKDEGGWSKVNGEKKDGNKKWSGVVNGTATPSSAGKRTPLPKESVKDNKVAYILFYQRIEA